MSSQLLILMISYNPSLYITQIVVSYGYDLSESPDWYKAEWERSPLSRAGVSFSDWQNCRVKLGPGGQILQTCQE